MLRAAREVLVREADVVAVVPALVLRPFGEGDRIMERLLERVDRVRRGGGVTRRLARARERVRLTLRFEEGRLAQLTARKPPMKV